MIQEFELRKPTSTKSCTETKTMTKTKKILEKVYNL